MAASWSCLAALAFSNRTKTSSIAGMTFSASDKKHGFVRGDMGAVHIPYIHNVLYTFFVYMSTLCVATE